MERNIKAITDFIFISDDLSKANVIIVPGTFRIGIVEKALEVYQKGMASYIVTTGGVKNEEGLSESEFQKQYLIDNGVPSEIIFHELKSTNTKENAIYAKEKLDEKGIKCDQIILVSKTYHARRILMTFLPSFKDSNIQIASVVDDRNITKDNWFKDSKKIEKVMEEVQKTGKYFLKGDLSL
jgi:uncharacterized SAM-binding protein YcdF (DUF218 family)